MLRANVRKYLLCLVYAFITLSFCALWAAQTATIKERAGIKAVKKVSTTISLTEENRKLYLKIQPAPDRFELYAGKSKLATVRGNSRTRFDISRYAERSENGQLLVTAIDSEGKKFNKALDVSKYMGSLKRATGTVPVQKKGLAKAARKEQPAAKKGSTVDASGRSSAGTAGNQKISSFLREIEKAGSLKDLERGLRAAKLSDMELRQLAEIIKEGQYRSRLESIAQRETSGRKKAMTPKKDLQLRNNQRTGTVSKAHSQRLERIKREFDIQVRSLKKGKKTISSQRLPGVSTRTIDTGSSGMKIQAPRNGTADWSIDSVSPSAVRIGGNVTIVGTGFGLNRGRVVVRFENTSRTPRTIVECDRVLSWSDSRIVATIPERTADIIRDMDTPARIWVKVSGSELGPLHEITLLPDFSLLPPEITRMSDTKVIPRQPFLIQGRNFLDAQEGTVILKFSGKEFPATVRSWDDAAIEIQVPYIIKLMETSGWIAVRNHAGYEATAPIRFEPEIWEEEIFGPGDGSNPDIQDIVFTAACSPWVLGTEYYNFTDDNPAWLLCLFGEKKEKQIRIRLNNEFTVVDAYIEPFSERGWQGRSDCGAYFERGPQFGSHFINTTRVVWTNALSRCEFRSFFVIAGPAGLWYNTRYDPGKACIDFREHPSPELECK